tara:strand:- start:295 stop:486 length:192 start_codon:yes stop_codon:yes gene_type:complete
MKQQIPGTLKFINDVLKEYLSSKNNFQGKKFTGCVTFKISCTDGGISNVDADVRKYLKKNNGE